jgi:hypothetical protein
MTFHMNLSGIIIITPVLSPQNPTRNPLSTITIITTLRRPYPSNRNP